MARPPVAPLSRRPSPIRGLWLTMALCPSLALLLTGCPNSVGITCPPGQCDVVDDGVAADQAVVAAPDLLAPLDFATPDFATPDFATPDFATPDFAMPDLAMPDLTPLLDATTLYDLTPCALACTQGCCDANGICHGRSLSLCPGRNRVCTICDLTQSDTCTADGCACGNTPSCDKGRRCVMGVCKCDSLSCPLGCCEMNTCLPGGSVSACGAGGQACATCALGQTCKSGVCEGCNANSCPNGCCSGLTCVTQLGPQLCGKSGNACAPCSSLTADNCIGGECRCGVTSPCAHGQRCLAGMCVCDKVSCQTGCCSAGMCNFTLSAQSCGIGGAQCTTCDPTLADVCVNGVCSCGMNPMGGIAACGAGQRCAMGTCVCDAQSCANGCCVGKTCAATPNVRACGAGGLACRQCDSLSADSCLNGMCVCGNSNTPCQTGQHCVGGACVCDGTSCANGCCQNNACVAPSAQACGIGGAACTTCGANSTCSQGVCVTTPCPGMAACMGIGVVTCLTDCTLCLGATVQCGPMCVSNCANCAAGAHVCAKGPLNTPVCVAACLAPACLGACQ